ncbi:MAG TPA: glycosyltransferase family 2 protein [Steroidobacteraceae bacterium]|nr:glycosyltransferase family 2 protein [Steroidobacteraceae bacterium]
MHDRLHAPPAAMIDRISIVVPTRNRAYTLRQVLESHYTQAEVDEIVIVDDAGTDDTAALVETFARRYPHVRTIYHRNSGRQGAAGSRMTGVQRCSNEIVLFCDDDDFLAPDYARTCRRKMAETGAAIVSGRHFYRLPGEALDTAVRRFGNGLKQQAPFDMLRFRLNGDARYPGDVELPFTHGIFMARRSLLLHYGFDAFYCKGNGFREESDLQMRAFLDGHRILATNETHAIHLHPSEVRAGGQRVNRLQRYFWTVYYTRYFYRKYFDRARRRLRIPYSRTAAIVLFALIEGAVFFVRPLFVAPARIAAGLRR